MRPILIISGFIFLQFINTLDAQDKIGFTIEKITVNGIEMDAIGTVIFNNPLTELEIKQCILPKNRNPLKNQKYIITKLKLVGTIREEIEGDATNAGIQLSGTAYKENDAHSDFNCIFDKKECKLNLLMSGMEYRGKLIGY